MDRVNPQRSRIPLPGTPGFRYHFLTFRRTPTD